MTVSTRCCLVLLVSFELLAFSGCLTQQKDGTLEVRINDEHKLPTAARVRVTTMKGEYVAPIGHQADFPMTTSGDQQPVEQDVILDNDRRFAYVDGSFLLEGAKETLRIEILKGFRYKILDDTINLGDLDGRLDIYLEKAFANIPEENWYTGDVHVHHINTESALLEIKAEDLNVCNLLISDFTRDHESFKGMVEPGSDSNHVVIYNQEYRENRLGHVNLLNLTDHLIEPAKEMRQHQYPLNIDAMDQVHEQQGHVSWAHFAAWPGLEGPLGIVLKKVDAVELLCTIDPFHEPIFTSDIVPEVRMNSGLKLWYRLLNCGFLLPITDGTDKMGNFVTVGANRTYALLDGEFNYKRWIEALNQGRTFVSNSPFISFTVNGESVGSIIHANPGEQYKIKAEVWSQMPLDRLEIIVNGQLLAEVPVNNGESYKSIEFSYQPHQSVWVAARAYQFTQREQRQGLSLSQRRNENGGSTFLNRYFGTLRPEATFSHTSPVYIVVDGQPIKSRDDAIYFAGYLQNAINWLSEEGSFPTEQAKQQVLETFEAGKERYLRLAD